MEKNLRIYFTTGHLKYHHYKLDKMIATDNKIPFIVDWDGKLVEDINCYLLMKTELSWNSQSTTPLNNAQNIIAYLDFCSLYNVDWRSCSGADIRKYTAYLSDNKNQESTIGVKLSSIETMYSWLFEKEFIKVNPFLEFSTREVKRIVSVFSNKERKKTFNLSSVKNSIAKDINNIDLPTKDQLKSLYDGLDKETQLMMIFLLETGMRKEELLQLTNEMFASRKTSHSGNTCSIILNANKMNIKNNKSREIMLSDSLRSRIQRHLRSEQYIKRQQLYLANNPNTLIEHTPLFISNRGNKYSTDKLNKSFDNVGKKLGLKITPHELRHFFASNFIYQKELSGTCTEQDYMYLAERLGHSSVETTKSFYVKIVNRIKQQEDMEKYSDLFLANFLGGYPI